MLPNWGLGQSRSQTGIQCMLLLNLTSGGNKFYDFPQTQLIKYGAAMSFAFKEELSEL